MPYEDTENKKAVRRVWDRPIIEQRRALRGQPLVYLGMTGPEMHDVLDWHEFLARHVTAVEELTPEFYDNLSRMYDVATVHDIDIDVMQTTIEDLIAKGVDDNNAQLRRLTVVKGAFRFSYDLLNLDFDGGLINIARHRAVERLLLRQQHMAFTLLMTYNVRHKVHTAIAQQFENLRNQVGAESRAVIDWYAGASQPQALKLKATVPSIIAHAASAAQLDCRAYPPVRYIGHEHATMLHFAFDLTPRTGAFLGHSQNALDLVTLPLIEVIEGVLRVSEHQDPAFDLTSCTEALGFLPAAVREAMLTPRPPALGAKPKVKRGTGKRAV
jgi:hypothetical protein